MTDNLEVFPGVQGSTEAGSNQAPEAVGDSQNSSWYWDENTPGTGEKPEFFNDGTFKSVTDQAKAWGDLRKHLGGFTGAPDQYEVKIPDGYDGYQIDQESPLYQKFTEFAKNSNMSQDKFQEVIDFAIENEAFKKNLETQSHEKLLEGYNEELGEYWKSELERIGENAHDKVADLRNWIKTNIPDLTDEKVTHAITSADAYEVLNAMREKTSYGKVPISQPAASTIDKSELRSRLADPRYAMDPDFREAVDRDYKIAYANEPSVRKPY